MRNNKKSHGADMEKEKEPIAGQTVTLRRPKTGRRKPESGMEIPHGERQRFDDPKSSCTETFSSTPTKRATSVPGPIDLAAPSQILKVILISL
jgi:hypothetical protein